MKKVVFIIMSLFMAQAQAQTFGLQAGVHNATAELDGAGLDEKAELNYRLGVVGLIDLTDMVSFRTGLTYTTRHTVHEGTGGSELKLKFSYLDVPVLFQFQLNEMIALYAGGVVGFNMDDKFELSGPISGDGTWDDTESMIILGQIGANFMFDGIGFDLYVERGLTDLAGTDGGTQSKTVDFMTYGANFVMLF